MFIYPNLYTFLSRSVRGISCIESQSATRKYITFSTVITRTEIEAVTHDMTRVGLKRNRHTNGGYLKLQIFVERIKIFKIPILTYSILSEIFCTSS